MRKLKNLLGFNLGLGLGLLLLLGLESARPVTAKPKSGKAALVSVVSVQQVQRAKNGQERLRPVQKIEQGDILEYRKTYTNISDQAGANLNLDLNLPAGLRYQHGSASPSSGAEANTGAGGPYDALHSGTELPSIGEDVPNTNPQYQPTAMLPAYRNLRWKLPQLLPGQTAQVSVRVTVDDPHSVAFLEN